MKTFWDNFDLCIYSKCTAINLRVIMMKSEIELIISAVRFYSK